MLLTLLACSKPPPLILLISLDTTRADALGPYGGKGTPTIDRHNKSFDSRRKVTRPTPQAYSCAHQPVDDNVIAASACPTSGT